MNLPQKVHAKYKMICWEVKVWTTLLNPIDWLTACGVVKNSSIELSMSRRVLHSTLRPCSYLINMSLCSYPKFYDCTIKHVSTSKFIRVHKVLYPRDLHRRWFSQLLLVMDVREVGCVGLIDIQNCNKYLYKPSYRSFHYSNSVNSKCKDKLGILYLL